MHVLLVHVPQLHIAARIHLAELRYSATLQHHSGGYLLLLLVSSRHFVNCSLYLRYNGNWGWTEARS